MRRARSSPAFTLVELLVVIAIVGVLIALLLPAIQAAREAARRTSCKNQLRQVAQAMQLHHDSFGDFPAGWITADPDQPDGAPGWGWAVRLLPYIEQRHVYDQIDQSEALGDAEYAALRQTIIPTLVCPSDIGPVTFTLKDESDAPLFDVAKSNYVAVFGTEEIEDDPANGNGMFFQNRRLSMRHMADGTSTTFLVGERSSRLGSSTWVGVAEGADEALARVVGAVDHPPNHEHAHLDDFSSDHPQGAHFVFGDTSVRMIANDIDADVYKAMATRAGNDEVPGNFFKD